MRGTRHGASGNGQGAGNGQAGDGSTEAPKPPTSDDLKDGQLATTFTHQALAVREAVLKDAAARRRILAIVLHEKVRSEALAIRHDANGSTVHADNAEGFTSAALDGIRKRRAELDPLQDKHYVEDHAAYDAFQALSDKKLDALIDLLTVECITAHLQRRTELVWRLAAELGVEVRRYWRPDERWLSGYQKIQLAHLIGELRGPVYAKAAELKKKSELVADLAKLFTEAAEGRMGDAKVAANFNACRYYFSRAAMTQIRLRANASADAIRRELARLVDSLGIADLKTVVRFAAFLVAGQPTRARTVASERTKRAS